MRHNSGTKHYCSKLTDEKVLEIRALYKVPDMSMKQLAGLYNISPQAVDKIVNYKSWKHLP